MVLVCKIALQYVLMVGQAIKEFGQLIGFKRPLLRQKF